MKFKILAIYFLSIFCETQASEPSSSSKPLLTIAQLQEIRARQAAVVAAEPEKIEIGTADVVLGQVYQVFTYQDGLYKGIGLRDFSTTHSDLLDNYTQQAIALSSLSGITVNRIYSVLKEKPEKREIKLKNQTTEETTRYKIVGIMPSSIEFQDDLFNIDQAKEEVLGMVHEYIDVNHGSVHRVCTGLGLPTTNSKEVWAPGCCDVQMHRSCFKQSQHNMITNCINPFCQKTEGNTYCRASWTADFYKDVISRQPVVSKIEIRDAACPVCSESLKPTGGVLIAMASKASKKSKKRKFSEGKA